MMIRDLPPGSVWSLAGIGDYQVKMNSVAIVAGGGVRVGLEDNIWYDQARTRLARNADLLERIHSLAEAHERPLMSSAEFRNLLDLEEGNGRYGVRTGARSEATSGVWLERSQSTIETLT
jgi:uncharacterized protein (DUF849 family)